MKSSFSGSATQGECVDVEVLTDGCREVRDTKDAGNGPVLTFTAREWAVFVKGVKAGEFDVPGEDMDADETVSDRDLSQDVTLSAPNTPSPAG